MLIMNIVKNESDLLLDQLAKRSQQGDKIAIFGAGRGAYIFYGFWLNAHGKPFYRVYDNDTNKHNEQVWLLGDQYKICPPNDIEKVDALIITSKVGYDEIRSQVTKKNHRKESMEVYYYKQLIEEYVVTMVRRTVMPKSFRITESPIIPKVIHYCWFGGKPLPENCKQIMKSWREQCKDYEIIEWNEKNYDVEKNAYMREAYNSGRFGLASDYARLDIIYQNGGIYLDTDVELLKPLDDFLYQRGFAGFNMNGVSTGLGVGAIKGLPIIKDMRDDYEYQTFIQFANIKDFFSRRLKLCSDIQTDFLERRGLVRNGFKFQDIEGLRIYPMQVLCGVIGETPIITEHTYAFHHFLGLWATGNDPSAKKVEGLNFIK